MYCDGQSFRLPCEDLAELGALSRDVSSFGLRKAASLGVNKRSPRPDARPRRPEVSFPAGRTFPIFLNVTLLIEIGGSQAQGAFAAKTADAGGHLPPSFSSNALTRFSNS
jgi:hypothetical protein